MLNIKRSMEHEVEGGGGGKIKAKRLFHVQWRGLWWSWTPQEKCGNGKLGGKKNKGNFSRVPEPKNRRRNWLSTSPVASAEEGS